MSGKYFLLTVDIILVTEDQVIDIMSIRLRSNLYQFFFWKAERFLVDRLKRHKGRLENAKHSYLKRLQKVIRPAGVSGRCVYLLHRRALAASTWAVCVRTVCSVLWTSVLWFMFNSVVCLYARFVSNNELSSRC